MLLRPLEPIHLPSWVADLTPCAAALAGALLQADQGDRCAAAQAFASR